MLLILANCQYRYCADIFDELTVAWPAAAVLRNLDCMAEGKGSPLIAKPTSGK